MKNKLTIICAVIISIIYIASISLLSIEICKYEKITEGNEAFIEYQSNVIDSLENSLKETINHYEDSLIIVNHKLDSLTIINDKVMSNYMLYQYKIERIKYYTKIVDKDASQMCFYKGWIKRCIE